MNSQTEKEHVLEVKYFDDPVLLRLLVGHGLTWDMLSGLMKGKTSITITCAEMLDGIPNYTITIALSTEKIQWIKWFEYHFENSSLYKMQSSQ